MRSIPAAEARRHFSRLVEQAAVAHERFEITRNGLPSAVLLGADDYDSIMETLDALSDSKAVTTLEQGIKELDNSEVYTAKQVNADMRKNVQE